MINPAESDGGRERFEWGVESFREDVKRRRLQRERERLVLVNRICSCGCSCRRREREESMRLRRGTARGAPRMHDEVKGHPPAESRARRDGDGSEGRRDGERKTNEPNRADQSKKRVWERGRERRWIALDGDRGLAGTATRRLIHSHNRAYYSTYIQAAGNTKQETQRQSPQIQLIQHGIAVRLVVRSPLPPPSLVAQPNRAPALRS